MKDYSKYIFNNKSLPPQDNRPWWVRLLSSLRPTANIKGGINPQTGKIKHKVTIGVKGGVEF